MDALHISGKWYISSRRAAKEHGYHSDYIGQLIRTGKVKGQKVGRSWYVLADSFSEYLEKEAKNAGKTVAKKASAQHKPEERREPVLAQEASEPAHLSDDAVDSEDQDTEVEPEEVPPTATPSVAEMSLPQKEISAAAMRSKLVNIPASSKPVSASAPDMVRAPAASLSVQSPKKGPDLLTYLHDDEPIYPGLAASTVIKNADTEHAIPVRNAEPALQQQASAAPAVEYAPVYQPEPPLGPSNAKRSRRGAAVGLLIIALLVLGIVVALSATLSTTISVSA